MCVHCTGMPETIYDAILENDTPNFIWSCDSCARAVPTIKNMSKMLQEIKCEQGDTRQQMKELHKQG